MAARFPLPRDANALAAAGGRKNRSRSAAAAAWHELRANRALYILFLPVLVYYVVFRYLPMGGAFLIAFKNYDIYTGIAQSRWAGFKFFRQFFESIYFWRLLKNTMGINLFLLLFSFPAPIVLALLLNEVERKRFKRTVQTISYLPHFISIVVIASMVISLLSPSFGMVNNLLESLGLKRTNFLAEPRYFWTIYTLLDIWQNCGFGAILYLAALAGVDPGLYEAATIDGAGRWRQTWHITIPSISPTIIVLLLMRLGRMLEVGYEAILLLYNPRIYETADVIGTYVYRRGIIEADYSFATAVGLFQSVLGLLLILVANRVSKKYTGEGLW
jgi:putative aldouronate transport system permease protein